MDPIKIELSIDAQKATESVSAFVEATKESIERAYTTAADKATTKLDEIIRKQQNLRSALVEEKDAVTQLESVRSNATEVVQKGLDQEINKLKQVIQQHQLEILTLDAKKVKQEEAIVRLSNATDQEKLNARYLTDAALTNIKVMQDVTKAQLSVKDGATAASQSAIDGIYKVVAQQQVYSAALSADEKKLVELQQQREQTDGAEKKRVENQIESMKRIIASRKDELLVLDAKRVKLEEELALSNAVNQQEEAGIRKLTQAELAEIEIKRDAIRAQNGIKDSTNDSADAMDKFLAKAAGLITVAGAAQTAWAGFGAIIKQDQDMLEKMLAATGHFRDLNATILDKAKPFLNEMGITAPADQQKAMDVLFGQIAPQNNISQSTVASTASAFAAPLKQAGITNVNDPRFADLVGTGARFVNRGTDAGLLGNVLVDSLRSNPNLTGDQFNQSVSNMIGAAGSPQRANEMMQIVQEQRQRYGMLGLGTDAIEKMFVSAGGNGIAPEERGSAVQGYIRGLDRFVGKTPEQYQKLYEEMTGVRNVAGQGEMLSSMGKFATPQQMLQREMSLRHLQSFPELDSLFKAGVNGGQVDMSQIASAISGMDAHRLEQVMTAGGGPRATAASLAVGNWSGVSLPGNVGLTPAPSSGQESAAAQQELQAYVAAKGSPTSAGQAGFETQSAEMQKYLEQHPQYLAGLYNPASFGGRVAGMVGAQDRLSGGADPKRQAQFYALAETFVALAQELDDIDSGKIKADPTRRADIEQHLQSIGAILGLTRTQQMKTSAIPLYALERGKAGNMTRSQALEALRDKGTRLETYRDSLDMRLETTVGQAQQDGIPDYLTPDQMGDAIDNASKAARRVNPAWQPTPQGPPAPTRQGPTSMNIYNTRQTIYGYTADSISGGQPPSNNYG